jgi:multisubunit Na+/H+ antiporter MnhG subunit
MPPQKSFSSFYETTVRPSFEELLRQNKKADGWGIVMMVAALLIIPVLILGVSSSGASGVALIIIMVVLVVSSVQQYTKANDAYQSNFKEQVVEQVIKFIDPGFVYRPDVFINSYYYRSSSLYRAIYDDYDGDDLIEGKHSGVPFKCSELVVTRGSSFTIFRGLFFAATVNPRFNSGTYIWFSGYEQLPASLADERYRLLPLTEVVKVDFANGDFENNYSVYTTNVQQASEIISNDMMQRLVSLMKRLNRAVTVSVVAGMCYVAVPFELKLLEPPNGRAEIDEEKMREYYNTIMLIPEIIDELDLKRLQ